MLKNEIYDCLVRVGITSCNLKKTTDNAVPYTFLDFCSGIGGGRLGLENAGFKCLGFSEIDKKAIITYKKFFDTTNEIEIGDLMKIKAEVLPDFDVLISGFPCQTFSIVGKRAGLNDDNKGQIIYYLCDIIKTKRPKAFILENVKGLVNHNKGETLKIILDLLKNIGYNVSYKVLNTVNFGLAQSRERIYFIGIRNDLNRSFSFENLSETSNEVNNDIKMFLELKNEFIIQKDSQTYATFLRYCQNKYNIKRVDLNALLERNFLVIDTRQSDLRIYENKIPTLRRDRQGIYYVYSKHLYFLSPKEALKFQGFDKIKDIDSKIIGLGDGDILRQCGNAMSVNVIESIGKNLLRTLNG